MNKHLFIGGMIAAGFDKTGTYLLTVSHSGRGLYSIGSWERVARNNELAYPENGVALGIGPVEGELIPVVENYDGEVIEIKTPNGEHSLSYSEGTLTISGNNA